MILWMKDEKGWTMMRDDKEGRVEKRDNVGGEYERLEADSIKK